MEAMCTLRISATTSTLPATRALELMLAKEKSSAQHSEHQKEHVQPDKAVANPKTDLTFDTLTLFDAVSNSFMKQHHDQLHEFPTIEWFCEEDDGKLLDFNGELLEPRNVSARHGNKPSLSRSIAFPCDLERLSEEPFSS